MKIFLVEGVSMKYTGFILVRTKDKQSAQYVINHNTMNEINSVFKRISEQQETILSCSFTLVLMVE